MTEEEVLLESTEGIPRGRGGVLGRGHGDKLDLLVLLLGCALLRHTLKIYSYF